MFNRTSGADGRRSAHFFLGVLAGAAAVAAYAISCDATSRAISGTAGGTSGGSGAMGGAIGTTVPPASDVPYLNAESGLGATTVQAAIDEVGTTMFAATGGGGVVTGGASRTTTWSMEVVVLDVDAEELQSTNMGTLKFTESAPGRGSYETSEKNFFMTGWPFGELPGTKTGKYFIVGNLVTMTGDRVAGGKSAYTWMAHLANAGRTITLSNFGSVTVVLKKQ